MKCDKSDAHLRRCVFGETKSASLDCIDSGYFSFKSFEIGIFYARMKRFFEHCLNFQEAK